MWRAASVSFITITTSTGPTDKPTPDGGDQTFHHGRHVPSLAVRAECVADFREVEYVPPLRHGRRVIGRRHSVVSPDLAVAPRRGRAPAKLPFAGIGASDPRKLGNTLLRNVLDGVGRVVCVHPTASV